MIQSQAFKDARSKQKLYIWGAKRGRPTNFIRDAKERYYDLWQSKMYACRKAGAR